MNADDMGFCSIIFKCTECGTHSIKERLGIQKEKKFDNNYYYFCKVCTGTKFELKNNPYQVG